MKRIVIVFIVLLFWMFLQEIFAGGVLIDFEAPDEKTAIFAKEFILEIQKNIDKFRGEYEIRGHVGTAYNQETGETKSAIGIFVNDEEIAFVIWWYNELASREEIKKDVKEVVDYILEYLKKLDKKTIKHWSKGKKYNYYLYD